MTDLFAKERLNSGTASVKKLNNIKYF